MFNLPPATLWLAAVIGVSFFVDLLLPGTVGRIFFDSLAFNSLTFWPPGSDLPSLTGLLTLATYTLLHGDFMHLALNLGFLLAFGSYVERSMGLLPYLFLFIVCAVAGALTEYAFRGGSELVLIGASGSVYGVTAAAICFMRVDPRPDRRRTALAFVAVLMGLNLMLGLTGLGEFLAGAQVGWKAHLGGFLAGLLIALAYCRWRPPSAPGGRAEGLRD